MIYKVIEIKKLVNGLYSAYTKGKRISPFQYRTIKEIKQSIK